MIITGLEEKQDEDPEHVVQEFFTTLDQDSVPLVRCHRLGAKPSKQPRPMIVRFQNSLDRNRVWSKRFTLKGKNIWLKEDLPASIEKKRQRLYPVQKEAKRLGKKTKLIADRLTIDGVSYTVETLSSLPENLKPENISTVRTNKFVLFYSIASPYSNFHPCTIRADGYTYNCSEQMYQHKKALSLGDHTTAAKVMHSEDASEQKRLGDSIKVKQQKSWLQMKA